jgi:hypothetical protein
MDIIIYPFSIILHSLLLDTQGKVELRRKPIKATKLNVLQNSEGLST